MCGVAAVGMVITAASTIMQGMAAQRQGEQAQAVAEYNARQQENTATQIRNKGVEQENVQRQKVAQMVSAQRAQFGAQNVALDTGSAADVQLGTQVMGEADALRIRSNYLNEAQALTDQAGLTRAEGAAKKAAGDAALTGSVIGAAGSVFSSGVADKWFTPSSSAVQSNISGVTYNPNAPLNATNSAWGSM